MGLYEECFDCGDAFEQEDIFCRDCHDKRDKEVTDRLQALKAENAKLRRQRDALARTVEANKTNGVYDVFHIYGDAKVALRAIDAEKEAKQ